MKKYMSIICLAGCLAAPNLIKAQAPFVGQIMFVPYTFAPSGWHDCDGSLQLISDNETLFALIGTTYGGNGQTTFALPNAKGRVIVDDGQGSGLSNYQLGQMAGSETVTLTTNQLPIHSHTVMGSSVDGNQNSPTNGVPANTKVLDKEYSDSNVSESKTTMKSNMLATTGGSQPHNNMMPSLAMKCIIALYGVFPSRN